MAAGLLYLNNSFGLTTENKISATYSWTSRLGSGELSFGAQAGVVAIRHNWAAAQTTQAEDPVFAGNMQKSKAAEFGAGTYYSNARFFAGLSSPALYRTEKGYSLSDSPVMLYSGGLFNLNEDLRLKPAVLLKYLSNSPVETDLTATVYWKEVIGVGLGYRTNDAVYAFFDLQLNEQTHLGYCYDYTVSALRSYSNGSHEVMLRYLFSYKVKSKSPRFF
jgi:type IX secretion system PorP/SprF family membrane protein